MAPTITLQKQPYRHVDELLLPRLKPGHHLCWGEFRDGKVSIDRVEQVERGAIRARLEGESGIRAVVVDEALGEGLILEMAEWQEACPEVGPEMVRITRLVCLVAGQALMVSDQCQALHKHGLLRADQGGFLLDRGGKVDYLVGGRPVDRVHSPLLLREVGLGWRE
jgi:hypothetical protein